MAINLKINFDFKKILDLPKPVKIAIASVPSVIVIALFAFMNFMPKYTEIKEIEKVVEEQEKKIAESQSMAARLDDLKKENQLLKEKLIELQSQLPEEREITAFLKQLSDLGLNSGLKILGWKPAEKKSHPSGIVYEVPVDVDMEGGYHMLGAFFGHLTELERIVNISNIKLSSPRITSHGTMLSINFSALTYTAVPGAIVDTGKDKKDKKEEKK